MSIYMSRAELEEISEGLITAYANKFSNRVIQSIDIEHFITEFLMLRIEYASFAEDDAGRIGFLADGATPLLVHPPLSASSRCSVCPCCIAACPRTVSFFTASSSPP